MISLLAFNAAQFGQSNEIVLKSHNWFVNAVITTALVVYHFPVALINLVFVFPLLHTSVSLFGLSKSKGRKLSVAEWLSSNICFLFWLVAAIAILFGSVLLRDLDPKQLQQNSRTLPEQVILNIFTVKNDMLATTILDFECAGSNLWVYICCILIPNVLTILQV